MNEEQQRLWSLLQDALPNVATQMRGSLSNLYTAAGRLLPPEELEQQPELTQSAAILNQSYYRLLRMVNNLSALAILKEHTPFPTANVELVGWLDELVLHTTTPYISVETVRDQLKRECTFYPGAVPQTHALPVDLTLEEIEQIAVQQALQAENGNQKRAAERLGISRTTLWRMLQKETPHPYRG